MSSKTVGPFCGKFRFNGVDDKIIKRKEKSLLLKAQFRPFWAGFFFLVFLGLTGVIACQNPLVRKSVIFALRFLYLAYCIVLQPSTYTILLIFQGLGLILNKIYDTTHKPAILYGIECWAVKKQYIQKMSVVEIRTVKIDG